MSLSRRKFVALSGMAAVAAAAPVSSASASTRPSVRVAPFNPGQWRRVFTTDFPTSVPLGQFPKAVSGQWGAFAHGTPDTAKREGLAVGGIQDTATTTWVSGGQLHIRQWRGASGPVHCSTVFPNVTEGVLHGRFIEVTRVSQATAGYKSAHLLWGERGTPGFGWEVDFPENNWAGFHDVPHAFYHWGKNHPHGGRQLQFAANVRWTDWHTYEIRWQPGRLQTFCDGHLVGSTTQAGVVPTAALRWHLQNESSLVGAFAAPNSHAQIDTSHVEYWSWAG